MKKNIFLLAIFLCYAEVFAQTNPGNPVVIIDSLSNSVEIEHKTLLFIDSANQFQPGNIPDSKFSYLKDWTSKHKITGYLITKPGYLLFTLQNNEAQHKELYVYPGIYFDDITVYKKNGTGVFERSDSFTKRTGLVHLSVPSGQTTTYLLQYTFTKSEISRLNLVLVNPNYLKIFLFQLRSDYQDKRIASYILSGVLLMMILFTLVNYFVYHKIEFLYHCCFSICMFFLIFLSSYLSRKPGFFSALFLGYLDLILLITGTIFYLAFIRSFLDTRNKHRILDKLFKAETWVLIILLFLYSYVYFQTNNLILGAIIENSMKIIALLIGIIFIVKGLQQKDRLMQYLALGSAAQIFFSIISLYIILSNTGSVYILKSALFYFELGIIMVVFFFLLGLTYKNRRDLIEKTQEQESMKLEVEKKVFETKLAVINAQQEERNRISADMHDDLGAGMTTIRLFSELAKAKMGSTVIPEIEKISASADELLNKMNAIIWSMSSSNDTLGNMVAYIRSYALEYLDNFGIKPSISIPENLPELQVPGVIRRNVFLVVKEALNNIVKHAGATEVRITLQQEQQGLTLTIHDNGKGINLESVRQFGNGLKNMKKRMEDIGIDFQVENNQGTMVKLYRKIVQPMG